ncbi:MAG: adenylosuccinate lyase [Bacteroidales bacterium]|jgi:adenylosuccinate lyase|nr:adenylosuccinate lyase [Bacteroidales bacterium]
MLNPLTAISPIDGRYYLQTESLGRYFSEFALIRYRVRVEIEYFIALCNLPLPQLEGFNKALFDDLRDIYGSFTIEDALQVKEIEKTTNHDVKAVEYFIKDRFDRLGINKRFSEFVHFGLTSQDINNTSVPLSMREGISEAYMPVLDDVINTLEGLAQEWKDVPMLAHTHGQPASPTRLGKEIEVFVARLSMQRKDLLDARYPAKFGGATGNLNAHHVAYPDKDWNQFADNFVASLGLDRSFPTTQIEHYDYLAALFQNLSRINTILIDLCRDMWTYISMEYFKQKIKAGEVGSSAMPHKVNPIDFENAEGNLGVANAVYAHLAAKLPVSRMQRDLTDSTVLRNVGVPVAHSMLALKSLLKGLNKLILNRQKLEEDLRNNYSVVAEGIQTILRREGYPNPYETLKELTRTNRGITKIDIDNFINSLEVAESVKKELRAITPESYTGI